MSSDCPAVGLDERALLKRHGLDTVDGAFACAGGEELSKPGLGTRRRTRLTLTDESGRQVRWYLKRYGPDPLPVRLWRRIAGPGRVDPAGREFENISRLRTAGVPTMRAVAMGRQGDALGARRSYIIVTAVPGEALERCFDDFLARNGSDKDVMERFVAALANLVVSLHSAGLVHRDLYASHIFLEETPGEPGLYLIDLARVFTPKWRTFRWRVKDLAQLKYSMPLAWVDEYWGDFLSRYVSGPGRAERWAAAIDRKAASMRRRHRKKDAAGIA